MGVITAGHSDIGMKRKTNQDSICLYPQQLFFAVADGMGGHSGGDIASQSSVKMLPEIIEQNKDMDARELLAKAISDVNQGLIEIALEKPDLKGMGTTITCIMYKGSNLYVANVGDSRTYLIHNNKLLQLSRDHSLVQEKINMGIYTRAQGKDDPQKNVLVRTVGFDEGVDVDVFNYKVTKNDMFLLCSDGLHGKVSDHDIIAIMNKNIPDPAVATLEDVEKTCKILIQQANDNGGQDNISVIISIAQG